jgi:hypothetical protein
VGSEEIESRMTRRKEKRYNGFLFIPAEEIFGAVPIACILVRSADSHGVLLVVVGIGGDGGEKCSTGLKYFPPGFVNSRTW